MSKTLGIENFRSCFLSPKHFRLTYVTVLFDFCFSAMDFYSDIFCHFESPLPLSFSSVFIPNATTLTKKWQHWKLTFGVAEASVFSLFLEWLFFSMFINREDFLMENQTTKPPKIYLFGFRVHYRELEVRVLRNTRLLGLLRSSFCTGFGPLKLKVFFPKNF